MNSRLLKIVFLLMTVATGAAAREENGQSPLQVIYLVRHAEKVVGPGDHERDPPLTDTGLARAQYLAYVLKAAGIEKIYTTDYRRTRQTAEPLAQKLRQQPEVYDPRRLRAFARQLKKSKSHSLVVGHSNTTPQLVELLGGAGGQPIDEATEYDRLYIVIRNGDNVETLLQRFGPVDQALSGSD